MKSIGVRENIPPEVYFIWEKVFVRQEDKILTFSDDLEPKLFYQDDDKFAIALADAKTLVIQKKNSLLVFQPSGDSVAIPFEKPRQVKLLHSNGVLVRSKKDSSWDVRNIGFDGTLLWQLDLAEPFVARLTDQNTLILYLESNDVIAYRLTDGFKLWHINLKDLMLDGSYLYGRESINYDKKIFFHGRPENSVGFTLSLDELSGKELRRFDSMDGYQKRFGKEIYAVTGVAGLTRLNIDTFCLLKWDFKDILLPFDCVINNALFFITERGLLYFADGLVRTKGRVGVIDIEKNSVVQMEEIKIHDRISQGISALERFNDKVYVHTSDNNLHLYQLA